MGRLIKMDFYRLFRSKLFWITNIILFGISFAVNFAMPFITDWSISVLKSSEVTVSEADLAAMEASKTASFSNLLADPLNGLLMVILFISATGFLYADLKDGYIKNIAGQISQKGYTAFSKFSVIIFHNLFFMLVSLLSASLAYLICPVGGLSFEGNIGNALASFFMNFLLSIAMTSVVLFITAALGNKTLGIVVGVIYSVGALQLVYFGINKIFELIRIKDFDIQEYLPDTLYGHIFEVSKPEKLFTALAVALIFTAVFIALSVFVINKKDVK